ncbi:hypothetical protein PRIPAC_93977 [Pristionchus pacificus]|uniref:Uncharacterized protein n=1 Tax=Pristionchus pacificus TaxID=54126 RepID=A0A2A6BPH0_PRIPA|nr:hypothetical protein PRIPAC_93977 [Pristionchus pacificus]|eukprot:PDM67809.1 hypothetical protein PRIPAC_45853 [Pristionchus pacificus]
MIFRISSCPSFDPHFDAAYGACTFNETKNGCQLLDELRRVRTFSSSPLMICPVFLATIALACNVGYVYLLFTVWRRQERRFQKRDIFLIQRSAISIVTICLIYMSVFVWLTDGVNYTTTAVFLSLSSTNFLYIGGSKVAQSLLLYTAVIHPLFYSTILTVEHCVYIDVFITIIALVQGTLDGLSAASLFFPSRSIFDCSLHTCQYPLSITIIILRLIGFITVGVSYCTIMAMRSLRINLFLVVLPAVPLMGMLLSLALDPIFNVTSDSKISSLLSLYGLPGGVRRSRSTASHLSHRSFTAFTATAAPRVILPAATV